MMFGRSIYFLTSGNTLTVVSPIDSLFTIIVFACFCTLACIFIGTGRGGKVAPWAWTILILTFVLSVTTAHYKLVLDGTNGRVHVTTVLFFYPTHYDYSLAELQGASVGESEQADALRLIFKGGASLQLSPYNQMKGKGQAAFAINNFLQQHTGAGSPNL